MVVRDSGVLNMFDYQGVVRLAESLGYRDTADWMLANKKEYATGIFMGFEVLKVAEGGLNWDRILLLEETKFSKSGTGDMLDGK